MKPELIIVSNHSTDPYAELWLHGLRCDLDAGLIPSWIGAVLVSILADGTARMICISIDRWIATKMEQWVQSN
jgi:hypothetical protein